LPRLAEGEFALVQRHLEQAVLSPTDPVRWGAGGTELDLHILSAEAAAQRQDSAALAEHARRAEEEAQRLGHRLYAGIAHRAQGVALLLTGQPAAAIERHSRGLEIFVDLGTRWQLGQTYVERAKAHTATGDLSSARADYRRALESFEALGAKPAAALVHQTLQELG
jgi:tetratricopeptide (TPR) repeat protein